MAGSIYIVAIAKGVIRFQAAVECAPFSNHYGIGARESKGLLVDRKSVGYIGRRLARRFAEWLERRSLVIYDVSARKGLLRVFNWRDVSCRVLP